ncbi:hypothetical protein MNEG_12710 [Monoraphidium neglectum]|uniref:Uncharacterized protein n=1 Tax=Monoraphidium neglectum TaxID=145388 RepID=A0A0D2KHI8_9CHLO|nr:hypothetical protein MNEG_12710 [Monoraphidium neglectum]KIY95253.1 hypothetical protein MNEG_12710 [Monoraphidium neglectum]|eukprot:XP_013894273.1 hypothetical protein MNEG_12710 [Monoraphidium neglectum]
MDAALLSTLLASLAALHASPPPPWHSTARGALRRLAPGLRPRQLGLVMCSLAKLRAPLPPFWLDLLAGRAGELLGAARPARAPLRAAGRVTLPVPPAPALPAQHPFSDADLAAVVWSMPHLAHPNQRAWAGGHAPLLRTIAAATLPRLGRMALPQLVQLVVGFSRLGFHPGLQWVKSHQNACAAQYERIDQVNRARLREAYRGILDK